MRALHYGTKDEESGYLQPQIRTVHGRQEGTANTTLSYSNTLNDLRDIISRSERQAAGFGEHSGRRGRASAAAEAGVKWLDLKKHGRWASYSAAQRYIDNSEKSTSVVPTLLAAAAASTSRSSAMIRIEDDAAAGRNSIRGGRAPPPLLK